MLRIAIQYGSRWRHLYNISQLNWIASRKVQNRFQETEGQLFNVEGRVLGSGCRDHWNGGAHNFDWHSYAFVVFLEVCKVCFKNATKKYPALQQTSNFFVLFCLQVVTCPCPLRFCARVCHVLVIISASIKLPDYKIPVKQFY